jgi:hypothetical protein
VNSAIFRIVLASIVLITGIAEARSRSMSSGHARYAAPSWAGRYAAPSHSSIGAIAPQSRAYALNVPDNRATGSPPAYHRGPSSYSAVTAAPGTESLRRDVSGNESSQPHNDYRQIQGGRWQEPSSNIAPARGRNSTQAEFTAGATAESTHWRNDYRTIRPASSVVPASYVAPVSAPIPVQAAYSPYAAASGYNAYAGYNALPAAGLLVDVISGVAERVLASGTYDTGTYETDPAGDQYDRGYADEAAARY